MSCDNCWGFYICNEHRLTFRGTDPEFLKKKFSDEKSISQYNYPVVSEEDRRAHNFIHKMAELIYDLKEDANFLRNGAFHNCLAGNSI